MIAHKKMAIPTLTFNRGNFEYSRYHWRYPEALLIKDDIALNIPCQKINAHSYVVYYIPEVSSKTFQMN